MPPTVILLSVSTASATSHTHSREEFVSATSAHRGHILARRYQSLYSPPSPRTDVRTSHSRSLHARPASSVYAGSPSCWATHGTRGNCQRLSDEVAHYNRERVVHRGGVSLVDFDSTMHPIPAGCLRRSLYHDPVVRSGVLSAVLSPESIAVSIRTSRVLWPVGFLLPPTRDPCPRSQYYILRYSRLTQKLESIQKAALE